jgi:hypothetical protein
VRVLHARIVSGAGGGPEKTILASPRALERSGSRYRALAAYRWHNNHHAHPTSARHGLAWYEVDLNWYCIRTMQAVGLAWDVKLARIKQAVPYEENDMPVDEAVA